jgi:hypothetical protein
MSQVSHCMGCYDPEMCPGIHYGRLASHGLGHCEDCVLDDEFCQGGPYPRKILPRVLVPILVGILMGHSGVNLLLVAVGMPVARWQWGVQFTVSLACMVFLPSVNRFFFTSTEVISKVTNGGSSL